MRLLTFRRATVARPMPMTPPVHPEESNPLTDKVLQACSFNLPGFTVVRDEAEIEWVDERVAAHIASLDEWTHDFLDAEIAERHAARLAQIDDQAVSRTQDATAALAEAEAVRTWVAFTVAELRRREQESRLRMRAWADILAGASAAFQPPTVDAAPTPALVVAEAPAASGAIADQRAA